MSKILHCWKCDEDVAMLEDHEWAVVQPHALDAFTAVKRFLEEHRTSIEEALSPATGVRAKAFDLYYKFTGIQETDPNRIWHHHMSFFGPPCTSCGQLLRTPHAKHCAFCGKWRDGFNTAE